MHKPSNVRLFAALAAALSVPGPAMAASEPSPDRPGLPPLRLPLRSIARTKHGGGGSTKGRIMARRIDDPREYHPVSADELRVRRNRRKAAARKRK